MADIFIRTRDNRIGFMFDLYKFHYAELISKSDARIHVHLKNGDRMNVPYAKIEEANHAAEQLSEQLEWAAIEKRYREDAAAAAAREDRNR